MTLGYNNSNKILIHRELKALEDKITKEEIELLQEKFGIIYSKDLFDPKVDFSFKKMFTESSEESKKALIDFLNSVMDLKDEKLIKDLTRLNTTVVTESPTEKQSVLDVWIRMESGEEAIIEMQLENSDDFIKRTEYIISKTFSAQQIKGKLYSDLKKVVVISIMNFSLFNGEQRQYKYYSKFRFKDVEDGLELSEHLELHYFELVKLDNLLKKSKEQLTPKEMWAIFFKYAPDKNQRELIEYIRGKEEGIKMAAKVLEKISKDEQERIKYQEHLIWMADQYSKQECMRKKGFDEGVDKAKIEDAMNFLKLGVTEEIVAKGTGLSLEKVIELKMKLN